MRPHTRVLVLVATALAVAGCRGALHGATKAPSAVRLAADDSLARRDIRLGDPVPTDNVVTDLVSSLTALTDDPSSGGIHKCAH